MNGKITLKVSLGNKLHFDFELKRKVTILRGDSGSGKTTLANLVDRHERNEKGINVQSKNMLTNKPVKILRGDWRNWKNQIENTVDAVIFFDEADRCINTKEFAEAVINSRNYVVIATREKHSTLLYSEREIYSIHNAGKYNFLKPAYSTPYTINASNSYDLIIVEDSGAGFDFFRVVFGEKKVISARGNSNIVKLVKKHLPEVKGKILVIYDSAAFGPYIKDIQRWKDRFPHRIDIFAPESFEYFLLRSNMFRGQLPEDNLLTAPWNYANDKHASWERFFTALLTRVTETRKKALYSKATLNPCYKLNCCHLQDACVFFREGDKVKKIISDYNDTLAPSSVFDLQPSKLE